MNQDAVWMGVRYALILLGGVLVGHGQISKDDLGPLVDGIIQLANTAVAVAPIIWGFYVKWNTKTVSQKTGDRKDVPTLNAATGMSEG